MVGPANPAVADDAPCRSTPEEPPGSDGAIVPLYTDPADPSESEWDKLRKKHLAHPTVPLVQIGNFGLSPVGDADGGPGEDYDSTRFSKIHEQDDSGITVIGYVDLAAKPDTPGTPGSLRNLSKVEADVDAWRLWYATDFRHKGVSPGLNGIFLDDLPDSIDTSGLIDPADPAAIGRDFYCLLANYIKADKVLPDGTTLPGLRLIVANPGVAGDRRFLTSNAVDVLATCEAGEWPASLPKADDSWWWTQDGSSVGKERIAAFPYCISSLGPSTDPAQKVRYMRRYFGYIYAAARPENPPHDCGAIDPCTGDVYFDAGEPRWSTVPAYIDELLTELARPLP
jgi:hypothetical protein